MSFNLELGHALALAKKLLVHELAQAISLRRGLSHMKYKF